MAYAAEAILFEDRYSAAKTRHVMDYWPNMTRDGLLAKQPKNMSSSHIQEEAKPLKGMQAKELAWA